MPEINEKNFKSLMMQAKTFQKLGEDQDYWMGYQRGLRRAFHGGNFGTEQEHELWLAQVDSTDASRRQRGEGYRDGLEVKPIGRGGAGRGQGRNSINDEPMVRKNVMLDQQTVKKAQKIGEGNLSDGIRIAVTDFDT